MWTECLMATSVSTTYLFVELQSWGSKLVISVSKLATIVAVVACSGRPVAVALQVASSISQSILAPTYGTEFLMATSVSSTYLFVDLQS